jgi:adenylosuccinate lyase
VPALENVVLWHERDISNSSVERVTLPGASTLVDYMLGLLTRILRGMSVDEARMRRNLDLSRGLFFSEGVLTALIERGLTRQAAYAIVQRDAMAAWSSERTFREVLDADPEVTSRLSGPDLDRIFDMGPYLEHIDATFARVGLGKEGGEQTATLSGPPR